MTTTLQSQPSQKPIDSATGGRFLMCAPDHYSIAYVINPWMEGNTGRARDEVAIAQWTQFHQRLADVAQVELLPPVPDLPDLCFTANAGLALGSRVILSRFRFAERQPEEPVNRAWFESHGLEVIETPPGVYFEGAGDALFDREGNRLWMGYGWRTVLEACEFVATTFSVEVAPLRLIDDRFYHLDTCLMPLAHGRLLYYPAAFDERSRRLIEQLVPADKRIAVSEKDALDFACNAVEAGRTIFLNGCGEELEQCLTAWGYRVVRTPLSEFILAGGAAKCLTLRLDEHPRAEVTAIEQSLCRRNVTLAGHLIDTGLLNHAMDQITQSGCTFETLEFRPGLRREDKSYIRLEVNAPDRNLLASVLGWLVQHGAAIDEGSDRPARLVECDLDGVAPDEFYCSTIYPTDVRVGNDWIRCERQRMDGAIVVEQHEGQTRARVTLMRNLHAGDHVVVGHEGLRVHSGNDRQDGNEDEFKFMSSTVSSERRVEIQVDQIAWDMTQIRRRGGRIVLVSGPVAVHTGGCEYLSELVRRGYISAVLAGNALAVHDIERALFGTSLGVDLLRGIPVQGGHRHHLRAINLIRRCGSIARAVELGYLTQGLMYELTKAGVPYCLAGSIRDDGPLPETRMDLIQAQEEYMSLVRGADMILMLSTMLHSIGVGNMTPAGVKLVCVDINTDVATKLADRGSMECRPVVTDVGLFLNLLVRKISELEAG